MGPVSKSRSVIFGLATALLVLGAGQSPAQEKRSETYQEHLLRLSEVLGGLHAVRSICREAERTMWRDAMQDLLRIEDPEENLRSEMSRAFNETFRQTRDDYFNCSRSADKYGDELAEEGRALTERMAAEVVAESE